MKVLHITPHLGGGVGAVLLSWLEKSFGHSVHSLDRINDNAQFKLLGMGVFYSQGMYPFWNTTQPDIVVVHYWDHPMLYDFLKIKLPPCRLVFWCHKNFEVPQDHQYYPDVYVDTSPVQEFRGELRNRRIIWSVRNMDEYLKIEPIPHPGFNIGYVGTIDHLKKKLHPNFIEMCKQIKIPGAKFIVCGEGTIPASFPLNLDIHFMAGANIPMNLSYFDVFGYPLAPDHYGTCEQALGEAMSAGVVPVCMDNPAERYIIDNAINGFLCNSEVEYIETIEILYKYPLLRKKMSDNARKKARELYNIDQMVREWNDLFEELMEQPKKEREAL